MKRFLFFLVMPLAVFAQDLTVTSPIRFLALGDSYTIGQSVSPAQRWPEQFKDSMIARGKTVELLRVLATTGWRTDNLIDAIIGENLAASNYNLVSGLIGVNNQYQGRPISQYMQEFPQLLDSAIRYAGGDTHRVFIVSIPDYAFTPFGQGANPAQISTELDQYNSIARQYATQYGIHFFDITPISRQGLQDPELVAGDGLHPSGKQYSQWVHLVMHYLDSLTLLPTGARGLAKKQTLALYPNPTGAYLTVTSTPGFKGDVFYEITDLQGRRVKKERWVVGKAMPIHELKPGLYHLKLTDGNRIGESRFVKQ